MKRVALALILCAACASSSPKFTGRLVQWAGDAHAPQERLEAFSAALARAGMSVPVPARVCVVDDDPVYADHARFDDAEQCVVIAEGDGPRKVRSADAEAAGRESIAVYALAITKARLPPVEAETRAAELADAYLKHDDAKLAATARAVENEFDALRLKKPKPDRVARREPPRRVEGEGAARAPVSEIADAGPATEHAPASPTREEPKRVDVGDAGPAAVSTRDKLVGTWAYDGGPIRNIYAMCGDGKYEVTFEVVDSSFEMSPDELPTVRGTWVFVDGDPPKITFSAMGETMEAPLVKIADDDIDITLDNESLHLTRRSKSASCD